MTEATMNLSAPRGDRNVWDNSRTRLSDFDNERWAVAACGSGLAMLGARRGGFGGGLVALLGAVLAVRAAMGRHDLRVARHWLDEALDSRGWRIRDIVQDASEESFPASDAPAWPAAD